jgi:hypothetical protein
MRLVAVPVELSMATRLYRSHCERRRRDAGHVLVKRQSRACATGPRRLARLRPTRRPLARRRAQRVAARRWPLARLRLLRRVGRAPLARMGRGRAGRGRAPDRPRMAAEDTGGFGARYRRPAGAYCRETRPAAGGCPQALGCPSSRLTFRRSSGQRRYTACADTAILVTGLAIGLGARPLLEVPGGAASNCEGSTVPAWANTSAGGSHHLCSSGHTVGRCVANRVGSDCSTQFGPSVLGGES